MKKNSKICFALTVAVLVTAMPADSAELVWIGATGSWNAAGNWSPAQVPTATDNAWITNSGTYTVTIPAGTTATVASLTVGGAGGVQTLAVDRATLTLNAPSLVDVNGRLNWLVSGSVVNGPGSLAVSGALNWANGTMSGTGTTTLGSGGSLTIGSGGVTLARTLNNGGAVSWSGGNFTFSAGNALNNLAGGTFDITGDGRLSGGATTPINNAGLFRLAAGTTGTTITAPVNNSGNLQVLAATLALNLGGTHTGSFSTVAGATLNLGGGSHVLVGGSSVAGAGVLNLSGGSTLVASGSFDPGTTLTVAAGVATLTAGCNVTGTTLNLSGANGVMVFNSSGTVATVAVGGGTLGGTSPLTVTGQLTLGGGSITNPLVTANGGIIINGNTTLNGGRLVNPATAVWSGGNIVGANGATISNLLGATFINTFDGGLMSGAGTTPLFINAGTFQKTNGTAPLGATAIDFQFVNTGTVEVRTNTLKYAANQQLAGLTLLDGGDLSAQAQPLQISGGSLMGTGLVTVANTMNVVNASSLSPGLPLGELDIAGNLQQTAAGVLNIELGGYSAGKDFDLVTVSAGGAGGVAALAGTLNLSLANNFAPTNGSSFTFLTASSRTGSFATFLYPSNDIGMIVSYDANSAKVTVSNLKPVVTSPIVDPPPIVYGAAFNFQFSAGTFTDPDGDALTYSATGMPPGVTFVSATRTFSGIPTQAGTFPVLLVANDGGTPNLSATNVFNIRVDPAILTVTAQPQTKSYGTDDPSLTFSVGGLQFSDTLDSVLTGTLSRAPGESVAGGPYAITQGTLAANENYKIEFTGDSLTINPATLAVTAQPQTKSYGSTDPSLTFTVSGLQFADTQASALTGLLSRVPGETVAGGPYAITQGTLAANNNYGIAFTGSTLKVTPALLTVTAQAKSKAYGTADPALTFTANGLQFSDTEASVLTGSLSRVAGETVTGGPYSINQGTLAANGNYTLSFTGSTLTVTPTSLTVTAQARTKTYGTSDPTLTFAVSGLQFSDTEASVLTGSLSRVAGETVTGGPYSINQGTLAANANYTIAFTGSTLTVAPASLTVTAQARTKTYGASDPTLTFAVSGLQFSDTEASALTGSLSRTAGETVTGGPYSINQGTLTANSNYAVVFTAGTLTITPAVLSVTAQAQTKSYGVADPTLTFTVAGLQLSDTETSTLTGTLTRAAGETVAGSPYVISQGTLAANSNYTLSFTGSTLTVTPTSLTVTAQAKTKTYGSADPTLTFTVTGLQFTDTEASVLTGTLNRAAGETVASSPYAISQGTLAANNNYTIAFTGSTLTVTPASLTVTAQAKTKTYGSADPTLTFTATGLQFTDTEASVLTGTLNRAAGETVASSSYAINQGSLAANGNYAVVFNGNTLTVTPASLTVTAQAKSKTYGAADPTLTFSVVGLQFTDTEASVLTGTLTRASGETVAGSPYAINQGTLAANLNYSVAFTPSTLTVTPAALTVTADPKTKIYGAADPTLTFTVSGLQFSDTQIAVLAGALARSAGEDVVGSPYAITQGTLVANGNYAIAFNAAALAITPAPLSIIADSKTKPVGAPDPTFTVSYTGFVNGETASVLGGTLLVSRAPGEDPGTYAINPSGLTSANYAVTFVAGALTITAPPPQPLIVLGVTPTNVLLSWNSVSNVTYRIQYKNNLEATNWSDLPGDVLATGSTAFKNDSDKVNSRFYRLSILQ